MSINPTASFDVRHVVPAHRAVAYNGVAVGDTTDKASDTASTTDTSKPAADKIAAKKNSDGFSFWDLVDIINPLQHIPIVSTIYREITGDKINGVARVAGGALFGGPIGAAFGAVSAVAASDGGKDLGETMMAKLGFGHHAEKETQVADAKPAGHPTVIEVHPDEQHAAAALADIEPGAADNAVPPLKKAGFDPAFDAADKITVAKPKAAPGAISDVALSAPLQAQIRRYNAHAPMPHKESTVMGLPQAKDVSELKPVAEAPVQAASPNAVSVPHEMFEALKKYQAMQDAR